MPWETIRERERPGWPAPYLDDYTATCASFSWEQARGALSGLPDGVLNMAFEAVDRHLNDGLADKVAIRWLGKDLEQRDIRYRELAALTSRLPTYWSASVWRAASGCSAYWAGYLSSKSRRWAR